MTLDDELGLTPPPTTPAPPKRDGLTGDQAAALESIQRFFRDDGATAFLLEGGAGVGKTWLLGQILHNARSKTRCVCAPTHKAMEVLRRKLDQFDVSWCRGYDSYSYDGSDAVTGTTAALLGISPIVEENQTDSEVKFGKTGSGILGKFMPDLLVIDEVSMVSWRLLAAGFLRSKSSKCPIR